MKLTITGTAKEIAEAREHSPLMLSGANTAGRITYFEFWETHVDFIVEEETKIIEEPKRWRAEKYAKYWHIDREGDIFQMVERNYSYNDVMWAIGNYFRTREEAEAAAEKVRAVLRGE